LLNAAFAVDVIMKNMMLHFQSVGHYTSDANVGYL